MYYLHDETNAIDFITNFLNACLKYTKFTY